MRDKEIVRGFLCLLENDVNLPRYLGNQVGTLARGPGEYIPLRVRSTASRQVAQ